MGIEKQQFTRENVLGILNSHIYWLEEAKKEADPDLCQEKIDSLIAVRTRIRELEE